MLPAAASTLPSDDESDQTISSAPANPAERGLAYWGDDPLPRPTAEQKASERAAKEGRRVEVTSLTDGSTQVFANPDGTFTAEASPVVERVKRGDSWVPIDTDLVERADGRLVPTAAQDVVLSGGGTAAPLATFSREGTSYELRSPWPLPEPKISGSLAVYESVRPDIDLVVQMRPDGFTHNLVVHTRKAASDPALRSIKFPLKTSGLSVSAHANGTTSMVDARGSVVFSSSAALMWDSAPAATPTQPASSMQKTAMRAASSQAAATEIADSEQNPVLPDPGSQTAVAKVALSTDALSVAPDQEFLAHPDTSYPVVIDPPSTPGTLTGWTTLWSNSPSTSFWKTSHALGVGYDAYVDNKKSKSLYQFDTRGVVGKKILGAQFTAYEIWSANCTKKDVSLYRTSPISSGTTWASKLSWTQVDTRSAAKGFSANCPDGDVEFDATAAVAHAVGAKSATTTLGLAASETDPFAWKQFISPADDRVLKDPQLKPRLRIDYISLPDEAPRSVKMSYPSMACSAKSTPAVIRTTTPRLTGTPTSVDAGNAHLRPVFELYDNTDGGLVETLAPDTWTASGTAGSVPTRTLEDGKLYGFTARTEYRYPYGGKMLSVKGPYSAGCYFKIDTSAPPKPKVTSTPYTECAGTSCDADPETGSVGMTGTFKIAAGASDVRRYDIWLGGVLLESKTFATNTASYEIKITPDRAGTNQLRVQTYDQAGNVSETEYYFFNVARPSGPVTEWRFDENAGVSSVNSAATKYPLTLSQASWSKHARLSSGLKGTGSNVYAATTGPVLNTANSFSVGAWVKLNSKDQSTIVQQQGVNAGAFQLYYSSGYDRWIFNRYGKDETYSASLPVARAISQRPPVLGAWTHLLGVYDLKEGKIRLYVNGAEQAETAFTTPWQASGRVEVGGWDGGVQLSADVDQVQLWNRTVFPYELGDVVNAEDPQSGHPRAAQLAAWEANETSGSVGADSSGRGNKLTLQPGAVFLGTSDYGRERVVSLDEAKGGHATSPVVLDNAGSFTVAGWVNLAADSTLDDTSVAHSASVFAHPGAQRDAFRLWYRQEAGETTGTWRFGTFATDVLEGPGASVTSDAVNSPTGWVHVAGVYDSVTDSLKLYLTGERQGADTGVASQGVFQPSGPLNLGRGRRHDTGAFGNHVAGQLDSMQVYAGVLSATQIKELARKDEPPVPID